MNHEIDTANTSHAPLQFSGEKFLNDLKKPAILKDCLNCWDSVPCTLKEFSEKYGTISFDFRVVSRKSDSQGPVWEGDAQFMKATIPQFVEWIENPIVAENSDNPLAKYPSTEFWLYSSYNYMFQVFPEDAAILKGVDWKPFGFEGCSGKDSTFWIGSSGAYTPCHFDTYGCNLVAQICGRKQWILFPPEDSDYLYPTRIPYEESSIFSLVNILDPDLTSHPLFKKCHPYIVTLEPGDVLFVPKQWWHFVRCLDASVSINTWIELPKNSDTPTRLEEAITRILMTSLIPTYEPQYESWLNPNEEFVSSEETMNYVLHNVQLLREMDQPGKELLNSSIRRDSSQDVMLHSPHKMAKLHDCSDVQSSKSSEHSIRENLDVIVAHPTSFLELMKVLDVVDDSQKNFPSSDITPKDIINCIVHPEVISLISEKLKALSKRRQSAAKAISEIQECT